MEIIYQGKIIESLWDGFHEEKNYETKCFKNKDKALAYIDEMFHKYCDKYEIEELDTYEYKYDDAFYIHEFGDERHALDEWRVEGFIAEVELMDF